MIYDIQLLVMLLRLNETDRTGRLGLHPPS